MFKKKEGKFYNQIFSLTVGVIIAILLLCWFACTILLNTFYYSKKKASMVDAYSAIDSSCQTGELYSGRYNNQLERFESHYGLNVLVCEPSGEVVFSSSHNIKLQLERMYESVMGMNSENTKIIEETGHYTIVREYDNARNEDYLVLWGAISDGNIIVIRCAIESIRESTALMNRFLIYVGVIAIVLGSILSAFVSKKVTKPIIELNQLAKQMTELDFDAKYVKRIRFNEIDELGESFNAMSEKLEATINELKEDIDKLEAEEKTRKDFITDVSHELKTPISLIQGYAEGLSEGIMDDEESRAFYLEVIMDEANHMNRLVRQLLDLSRAESSISTPEIGEFDLTELICGIIDNNRLSIEQGEIAVDQPTESHIIASDQFLIEQVLTNYISNALHHVEEISGNKKISVKVLEEDNSVRVSVFNTGNNIPKDDMAHLWDKFYKVDKARTREYGGSGIGLSIVKATIEKLRGEYGVINHSDGVEFYFSVPSKS